MKTIKSVIQIADTSSVKKSIDTVSKDSPDSYLASEDATAANVDCKTRNDRENL